MPAGNSLGTRRLRTQEVSDRLQTGTKHRRHGHDGWLERALQANIVMKSRRPHSVRSSSVTAGELAEVRGQLPKEMRQLFPVAADRLAEHLLRRRFRHLVGLSLVATLFVGGTTQAKKASRSRMAPRPCPARKTVIMYSIGVAAHAGLNQFGYSMAPVCRSTLSRCTSELSTVTMSAVMVPLSTLMSPTFSRLLSRRSSCPPR